MAEVASPEFSTIHMDTTKTYINDGGHSPISAPDARHVLWAEGSSTPSLSMTTETGSGSGGGGGSHSGKPPVPVAICGMAMRLPGGISTAEAFWDFLVNKGDACARIPAERYATHGPRGNQGVPSDAAAGSADAAEKSDKREAEVEGEDERDWRTHSYMLNHVDLAAFDASLFSMTRAELGIVDPQQRLLLEVTRECFENAGETGWRGKDVGVYIGSFGEDWNDIQYHDRYDMSMYRLVGSSDFVLANRISYEYDLKGPSMVLRTGCSASLYGLHLACQSLQSGDISSALVGGVNLIMNPAKVETMFNVGVLSKSASSKSFDAAADGYARGEAINMIYVKRLDDALRDGNPIRAVIRATGSNCDGKTQGLTKPSSEAHEALIRATYAAAGLEGDVGKTGFFECHATGTSSGDPEEATAVANVFGDKGGVYIGSVKPNMGHSEGASGLTSLLKCVLALENRVIPPNIKFRTPNPRIPFEQGGLRVPTEPVPWPADRHERASINSFGVGGANAHVIIDSTTAFGIPPDPPAPSPPGGSRLLVFTANDAESARRGALECSRHVAKKPDRLGDAAFTLGMRREHFQYRSFAIGDVKDASPVEFSSPVKVPAVPPTVAFVFTGQGAQWPTMGAKLLSEHPSALEQLRLMEMSLAALGPDLAPNWTLSEELLRPKESSKVYSAEFSQPLCTAVQIVVVNLLRDWGIVPGAVVGHSSGEIAAAYACGALTMEEAIVCAYLRGRVTTAQPTTRKGAMAAVGLGATDIQPYLVDGVVVACENSPSSTTLSGDEDKVVQVLKALEEGHPGVFTRRLQVDMAYHSHHMKELGGEYERLLEPRLSAKAPSVPFFSTVTNHIIQTDGELGASYWRSNLESPVLFRTGVEKLLQSQGAHSVLVEVGPHSALAGPVRQILKQLKAEQTSYVATLVRNEDDRRALLATAGQLFCKGLATIQFGAVNPLGRVLTSLPGYPWNHGTKYWYESRVSQEYRGRQFAHHQILGGRVVETSQTEPSWRNLLRLDNVPWCRDHKVSGDVIFPGTGYLAMAGEAMRQLSGARHVALRQITIASALMLSSATTEVVLSMRPYRLTNALDSPWHEFTISSYNETSRTWTKHCFGQVRAASDQHLPEQGRDITHLPRDVDPGYWYKALRGIGLSYGPAFQGLGRISADPLHNTAVADLRLDVVPEWEDQDPSATYYVHPATADACMQLFTAATARGQARSMPGKAVPTYIGEAYFSSLSSLTVTVEATADLLANGVILGSCVGVDPSTKDVVLAIRDVKLAPLDDGERADKDPHAGGRLHWKPDLDFQDAGRLIHWRKKVREAYYRLQKLVLLCCIAAREQCGGIEAPAGHLAKFQGWIGRQVEQAEREGYPLLNQAEVEELLQLSPADRTARIPQYLDRVLETEYATIGRVVCRVFDALDGILRGEVDGLEVLRQDDALAEIYSLGNQWDYGPFLGLLNHRTPHLRVLEIGAGTGATTDVVLQGLQGTFYSYTFTDVSAGFFPAARERFRRVGARMRFQTLDITRDPTEQGFAPGSFDLIVAANVLHVTPRLTTALAHVRRLLRPDGRLLMQEMHMTVKWLNFAMGPLPGWWLGEQDGRSEEPYVSAQRWADELVAAGFSPPQASVYDDEAPYQANVTIIAAPHISWAPEPAVSLLSRLPEGDVARSISAALQGFGLEAATVSLSEKPKGAVISILDLEGQDAYLSEIAAGELARFQAFLSGLEPTGPGMLWLTRPSQMRCRDPKYAGILGLLRTARNELGTPLSTLELDVDTASSSGAEAAWRVVFDVYQKMRRMRAVEQDPLADPDYEYAYSEGNLYLPRFHWISVADELAEPAAGERQAYYKRLEIGKRGSLQTMKWLERPVLDNLEGEEIYVDVKAVGINFKDTLIAMGVVNGPDEAGDGFGVEFSGVVRAVGPAVTDLSVGDRVMGISSDAYATVTRSAASRVIKMPEDLTFEDAASMPCVYPTVVHGLINLARLERGQSVLIHSACGGIGLAALNVCSMLGVSEVYATVGSPEKVRYLVDTFGLPPSRIFSSRDASFLPGVMRETAGRGVDVVLNSLSGELLHASWKCVAEFGSMVEIGKRDFLGQGRLDMEAFGDNRAFFGVEMWPIIKKQPARIRRLTEQFMGYYRSGALKPIRPVRVFDAADIEAALRTMQKGQHIGKLVIRIPEDASVIKSSPARQPFSLRADASYLLVGGLGGLGRSIATWMAERGAKHFVFLSRSGDKNPHAAALVRDLGGAGCTAQIVAGSVTEMSDVVRTVKRATMPIAGVIQLSMVLRDHLFADMPFSDWEAVTAPKIQGTWNLHEALLAEHQEQDRGLDFFVLFGSFAGLVGQRGQANYAAANAFLDAFVQFRHGLGLPASVLDLGAVADVGYVAERPDLVSFFKTTSHHMLREQDVLDALELAIRKSGPAAARTSSATPASSDQVDSFVSESQVTLAMRSTIPLASPQNRNVWKRDPRLSRYHNMEAEKAESGAVGGSRTTATGGSDNNDQDAAIRALLAAIEQDPSVLRQDAFIAEFARILGIAFFSFTMRPIEELDVTASFPSLGIDSLVTIEVRNWLRLRFAIDMTVLEILRGENIMGVAKAWAKKFMAKLNM